MVEKKGVKKSPSKKTANNTEEKVVVSHNSLTSYIMGILSIVFGVLSPVVGIVLGIVGIVQSRDGDVLAKKGKKLSTIGLIVGIVVLFVAMGLSYYYTMNPSAIPGY